MAALDRFGGLACQTMETVPDVQRAWQVLLGCPDVGLMVIGDDSCLLAWVSTAAPSSFTPETRVRLVSYGADVEAAV